jgi:hypothetical protein
MQILGPRSLNRSLNRNLLGKGLFDSASLDLRFAVNKTLDPRITFTRASTGTYVGGDGTLRSAATNEARFTHNPTTGESLGLLVEEARTNSLTNNTMVGAVAGTPGTLPTGWPFQSGSNGLAVSIVGKGTESGVAYLDWRISGTATAAAVGDICFGRASALTAQTWTISSYLKLVSGSLSGVTGATLSLIEETAASAFITGALYSISLPTTASLITQRPTASRTLTGGATVAQLRTNLTFNVSSGSTVDFTIRIGLPQLEQGAFATSVIPTTSATVTRAADVASITGSAFSSWYRQDEGTMFAEVAVAQPITSGNQFVFRSSDNTFSNAIAINISSLGLAQLTTAAGGVFDGNAFSVLPLVANVPSKIAGAYASNNLGVSLNGATAVTDSTVTIPTSQTRADIGSDHIGTNRVKAGTIKRLTYWPVRLPNTTLQAITQP